MVFKSSLLLILTTAIRVLKALGDTEIYGDILYPNSWDLTAYETKPYKEFKCYEERPAFYTQTKENLMVQGNGSNSFFNLYEICCQGFRRSKENWQKCIPDCSETSPDNCRNGFCRSPNHCECFEGFVKNQDGLCIETCPIACQNGHCFLDGSCLCRPGFVLDQDTRKYCVPDCSYIPCGLNQICTAPGECNCAKGYQFVEGLGCQPICLPDCGHGQCVAPNQCQCFPGFFKKAGKNICEADCYLNCDNGFCVSRYKCQCHMGFIFEPSISSCVPDCQNLCQHGVCIAPGICKCFEGYFLMDNSCQPICERGCGRYGTCIAPDTCACGAGQQICLGGFCSALGHCQCPPGMSHFIDECIHLDSPLIYNYDQREFYNKQLSYEFNALIGRLFKF